MKKSRCAISLLTVALATGGLIFGWFFRLDSILSVKVNAMSSIDTFVSQENSLNGRGANGIPLEYNAASGAAAGANLGTITPPAGQNAVIGLQSAVFSGGSDVVLLDGPRANYAIQVNSNGVTTIKDIGAGDASFGQTVSVTGESYILFNGAHISLSDGATPSAMTTSPGSTTAVLNYPNDIYFVANAANAQLAQFFSATLPWEPQPSLGGFEYWQGRLAAGMSLNSIAQSFLNTSYFQQTYGDPGTTHAQHVTYVETLYKSILGMTLDATNSGVQYWVNDMDTGVLDGAGILISFTNATSNMSPINANPGATAGAGTGWLINYSATNGYADPGQQETPVAALTQGNASGYINTGLIDPSQIPTNQAITVGSSTVQNWTNNGVSNNVINTESGGITVVLSTSINMAGATGTGDTIIGSRSGNSSIQLMAGSAAGPGNDTVILAGNNNTIQLVPYASGYTTSSTFGGTFATVTGFNTTDKLQLGSASYENSSIFNPNAHTPLNGSTLTFIDTATYVNYTFVVNVGNVGTGTTAEVAAAANKVYIATGALAENIVFVGTDNSGNAIVDWWGSSISGANKNYSQGDLNGNHLVDAAEIHAGVTLIGFSSSNLAITNILVAPLH